MPFQSKFNLGPRQPFMYSDSSKKTCRCLDVCMLFDYATLSAYFEPKTRHAIQDSTESSILNF